MSAKLDATGYRWLSNLSNYNFKLQYRSGSQNQDADGLSLHQHGEPLDDLVSQKKRERIKQFTLHHLDEATAEESVILPEAIKAICESHQINKFNNHCGLLNPSFALVESLALHADVLPDDLSNEKLMKQQRMDPDLKIIIDSLEPSLPVPCYCLVDIRVESAEI